MDDGKVKAGYQNLNMGEEGTRRLSRRTLDGRVGDFTHFSIGAEARMLQKVK